mgnify:CR=1 FL=1
MKILNNILASQSPRRKEILNQIGFEYSIIVSNTIENYKLNLIPEALAEHWAREKAKNVSKDHPNSLIIGADTIVTLDSKILGKPKNKAESISMLESLSGRTHEVVTGVSLINIKNDLDITFNAMTKVTIMTLNINEILKYIELYSPFDKAGSYGIQDGFSVYISQIHGCYYNVMGFPVSSFFYHYNSLKKYWI